MVFLLLVLIALLDISKSKTLGEQAGVSLVTLDWLILQETQLVSVEFFLPAHILKQETNHPQDQDLLQDQDQPQLQDQQLLNTTETQQPDAQLEMLPFKSKESLEAS